MMMWTVEDEWTCYQKQSITTQSLKYARLNSKSLLRQLQHATNSRARTFELTLQYHSDGHRPLLLHVKD